MNIAIIGAGYIGSEIGAIWRQKGFRVTATTRNPERLEELSRSAQKCVLLKGTDPNELTPLVLEHDLILVTIAADSLHAYEDAYLKTAQTLCQIAIENQIVRQLIYTSSTSIYGNHHGLWVDETSELKADTHQGKILIETERLFQSLTELGWRVCILRLAEIYGPGRDLSHRLHSLKETALPGSGDLYTNMVHKSDVAAAIDYAFRHRLEGIYNVADDDHPTRKELYDQLTHLLGGSKIQWSSKIPHRHPWNKRISNHKLKAEGFLFHYPHRKLSPLV